MATEFPYALATRVLRALARKQKRGQFSHFGDVGEEDLFQVGMMAATSAWDDFDPARSAPQTFIHTTAWRRIRDLCRSRYRTAERESRVAAECQVEQARLLRQTKDWVEAGDGAGLPGGMGGDDETIEDWLGSVYRQACHYGTSAAQRRGRRGFTFAQSVACGLLMVKRSLTSRGAVELFDQNADLRDAVGFGEKVPTWPWFWAARNSVEGSLNKKSGKSSGGVG